MSGEPPQTLHLRLQLTQKPGMWIQCVTRARVAFTLSNDARVKAITHVSVHAGDGREISFEVLS